MTKYKLFITPKAQRHFEKLSKADRTLILSGFEKLKEFPNVPNLKKLKLTQSSFRLRTGNMRIIIFLDKNNNRIIITHIGHRKDIYRN